MKRHVEATSGPVRSDPAPGPDSSSPLPSTPALPVDAAGCELRLAGPVCLISPGQAPVRLASAQAQAAVARLVLDRDGNGTTREQLAEVIWPEGLPDTWASAMRSVVSRIRLFLSSSGIAEADLSSRGGRYFLQLPASIAVDIEIAERQLIRAADVRADGDAVGALREAENAVRCFRRPFLLNREGEWAAQMRLHLVSRANHGLEVASRTALVAGEIGAAISHSTELVGRAPLRESAYRSLIAAYLAAGNRGDALATYGTLRSHLRQELGVDPSPESQQLYFDVLGAAPGTASAPVHRGRGRRVFIGRDAALATLDHAHRSCLSGSVQLVLVTGELGIGKSRVLYEFGRQISQGDDVVVPVQGRAFADSHCALVASLHDIAAVSGSDSALAELRPALEKLTAEFGHELAPRGAALALAQLILSLAARVPVTLILDDMDTADEVTKDVLRRLIFHAGTRVRLMLAVSATSARSAAALVRHAHELPQPNGFKITELKPFTPYEVHQLVSGLPDDAAKTRAGIGELMDRSGGNPFLLAELLAAPDDLRGAGALPNSITDYVYARMTGLDSQATALISYAAAFGSSINLSVVAMAVGRTGAAAIAIGELIRAGLLEEGRPVTWTPADGEKDYPYRFRHGLVREAIYAGLSTAERFEIHTRLLSVSQELNQEASGIGLPDLAEQQLAKQLLITEGRSSWTGETVSACREAASAAVQRQDIDEAIRLFRQALTLATGHCPELQARILADLGGLEIGHARPEGTDHLRDALLLGLQSDAIEVALDAASQLVEHFAAEADAPSAVVTAHASGEAEAVADLVTTKLLELPAERLAEPELGGALGTFLARSVALGAVPATPALIAHAVVALSGQLARLTAPAQVAQRAVVAEELWRLASAVEQADDRVTAAEGRSSAAAISGDAAGFRLWSGRLVRAVRTHPSPRKYETVLDGLRVMTTVSSGPALWPTPGDGPAAAGPGPQRGGGRHVQEEGPGPERQLLLGRWIRASFDAAAADPATARDTPADAAAPRFRRVDQSLTDLLNGDVGLARLRLRGLLLESARAPENDAELHSLGVMAIIAAELADTVAARQLTELLYPLQTLLLCHGVYSFAGPASYHLARLARVCGDFDKAEEMVTSSINLLSSMPTRPWLALSQQELARILRARGRPGDVRLIKALQVEALQMVRRDAARPAPTG